MEYTSTQSRRPPKQKEQKNEHIKPELKEYKELLSQMSKDVQSTVVQRNESSESIRSSLDQQAVEFPADSSSATFEFLKTLHHYERKSHPKETEDTESFEEIER
jgi:hypothetical protein